jgi:hypothetical protein
VESAAKQLPLQAATRSSRLPAVKQLHDLDFTLEPV